MRVINWTLDEAQGFMTSQVNAKGSSTLGLQSRKRYRGTLRRFSRFLSVDGAIEEDVFFRLKVK